jgi:hypothetical protein
MVNLARGNAMTYNVGSERVTVVPRQSKEASPQGKEKPQSGGK